MVALIVSESGKKDDVVLNKVLKDNITKTELAEFNLCMSK